MAQGPALPHHAWAPTRLQHHGMGSPALPACSFACSPRKVGSCRFPAASSATAESPAAAGSLHHRSLLLLPCDQASPAACSLATSVWIFASLSFTSCSNLRTLVSRICQHTQHTHAAGQQPNQWLNSNLQYTPTSCMLRKIDPRFALCFCVKIILLPAAAYLVGLLEL